MRAQPFCGPEANLATARAAQLGALQRLLTVLDPELAATIAHPPELESGGEDMAFDFAVDWVMLLGERQFDGQQVRSAPTFNNACSLAIAELHSCQTCFLLHTLSVLQTRNKTKSFPKCALSLSRCDAVRRSSAAAQLKSPTIPLASLCVSTRH